MNAKKALENISGLIDDYDSFAGTFDHQDHDENEDPDGADCRFDQYDIDEALTTMNLLVKAATLVIEAERATAAGDFVPTMADDVNVLALALGQDPIRYVELDQNRG